MRTALFSLALLTLTAGAATAAPQSHDPSINPPPAEPCFEIGQVTRYHGDGDRALIVRTKTDRYYRLRMAGRCPNLLRPDASIVLKSQGGSTEICRPVDLMVVVTASQFPLSCSVEAIQPMTASEVRALPAKNRP